MAMQIRDAVLSDFEEIKEIYNQIVLTSTATYNDWPATLEERVAWWQSRRAQGFPVLVAASETAGNDSQLTGERSIPGFASFGEFRAWPGYCFTVEGTVHVHSSLRGQGVGTALLQELAPRARSMGKHVPVAGVDAGNDSSSAFWRASGLNGSRVFARPATNSIVFRTWFFFCSGSPRRRDPESDN